MVQLEVKSNFTVALISVFMMLRIFKHVYLLIKSKILIDRDHASFFFFPSLSVSIIPFKEGVFVEFEFT